MISPEDLLWVEKYRPKTIEECILPERLKKSLQQMIDGGSIQNLMAIGSAGTGKTTIARALCNELGMDHIIINCSENGNIDTIRTTVRAFASTMSLVGGLKCVIFDEADGLTAAAQQSLRAFIEEFANNCRFIFTANFGNKIIEPLKSRTVQIDVSLLAEEKKEIAVKYNLRLQEILKNENIEFDNKVLMQVVVRYFPDMRRTINELQRLTVGGELAASAMSQVSIDVVRDVFKMLKERDFTSMRKWVATNPSIDIHSLIRMMWAVVDEYVKPDGIAQFLLHANNYQLNDGNVVNKEINMTAFLTELMVDVEYV